MSVHHVIILKILQIIIMENQVENTMTMQITKMHEDEKKAKNEK